MIKTKEKLKTRNTKINKTLMKKNRYGHKITNHSKSVDAFLLRLLTKLGEIRSIRGNVQKFTDNFSQKNLFEILTDLR